MTSTTSAGDKNTAKKKVKSLSAGSLPLGEALRATAAATLLAAATTQEVSAQSPSNSQGAAQTAVQDSPLRSAPSEVSMQLGANARLQGQTTLRFLRLPIYDARLWSTQSLAVGTQYANTRFALELQYRRRLEGKLIAERSIVEMRRIGSFDAAQAQKWQSLMEAAFPNVGPGDRITGIHDGKGGVHFYHNGRLTKSWQDAEFVQLFFGIWLSTKTPEPKLRLELLGKS